MYWYRVSCNHESLCQHAIAGEELYRNDVLDLDSYNVHSHDWHPDGRLVTLVRTKFVDEIDSEYEIQIESSPGSYRFETLFSFRPGGVFSYYGMRVNPTGNDAVVEGIYSRGVPLSGISQRQSRIFHFNLSGDFNPAVVFDQSEEANVNSPVFSPVGQYIMVTEGYLGGGLINYMAIPNTEVLSGPSLKPVILPASTGAISYVVPVGVYGQPMPPVQVSDSMRPVIANRSSLHTTPGIVGFYPLDGYSWTPAVD